MDPQLREDILFVNGGDAANLPFLYVLMSHAHGPEMISMLKKRHLRGHSLTEFIMANCQGEPIRFLKWAISQALKVNNPKTPRATPKGLFQ